MNKRQTTIVQIDISYLISSTHNDESKELWNIERGMRNFNNLYKANLLNLKCYASVNNEGLNGFMTSLFRS